MSLAKQLNALPIQFSAAAHVAYHAHGEQMRRKRELYIHHPVRVAEQMLSWQMSDDSVVAALLHDVIEDTEWTAERLLARGFSPRSVELVVGMTHMDNEDTADYMARILASGDIELMHLKLADLNDNSNMHPLDSDWPGWEESLLRYARFKVMLIKVIRESQS